MAEAASLSNKEVGTQKAMIALEFGSVPCHINSEESNCFLYRRSTYYWIGVFINFFQVSLCGLGLTFAAAVKEFNKHDTKSGYMGNMGNMYVSSGIYSIALFFHLWSLQKPNDVRFNAGMHYNLAKFEGILNFGILFMLFSLGPTFGFNAEPFPDNIRPILYPILIGLTILGVFSNITSAYITYQSAKRTRGTEMVPNPDHRVPAWMLAGQSNLNGIQRDTSDFEMFIECHNLVLQTQ